MPPKEQHKDLHALRVTLRIAGIGFGIYAAANLWIANHFIIPHAAQQYLLGVFG